MLEITCLHKTFHAGRADEKVALCDLSLKLAKGEVGVVIGSNGAGKSTMLNAIAGAFLVDSGRILIGGQDVTEMPEHRRATRVARVFQDPMRGTAAAMTVAENMLLAELRGQGHSFHTGLTPGRMASYAQRLSLLELGLENRLDAKVSLLSGGQRQALSLIMAVTGSPDLLLLDEHTAALDPRTADLVMAATVKAVASFELTTLMVTHNMQHAVDFGHRVIMLDAGRVHLEIPHPQKASLTIDDLVGHFSTKTDTMLLRK